MSGAQTGEYEFEPIPGLPEELPEGEEILWQGSPDWRSLARHVFHVPKIAVYFAVILACRAGLALADGASLPEAALSLTLPAGVAGLALGILAGLAWLHARASIYTLTNRRVVMRFGVALTLAVNLPFRMIQGAAIRAYRDGTGDIPLEVGDAGQLGYVVMWPHARSWRFGRSAQPMLRCVPEAHTVAEALVHALATPDRDVAGLERSSHVAAEPVAAVS